MSDENTAQPILESRDVHMYQNYRVKELVNETIRTVLESVDEIQEQNIEAENETLLEVINEECEVEDDDQLLKDLEEEYAKKWETSVEYEEFEPARTHWIQLQKSNKQSLAVKNTFVLMLKKYPHMRPIWNFGRYLDDSDEHWESDLEENFYFRHHCASIQATITMVMENKDEPNGLRKLLNDIGAHHFFYNANEPHFEVFQEAFMEVAKHALVGADAMDETIEASWNELLRTVTLHMSEGIAVQRVNYLAQCITSAEMREIREAWTKVQEFGFDRAGEILCETAFSTYIDLLHKHNLTMKLPTRARKGSETFELLVEEVVLALDKTISSYKKDDGFCGLVDDMQEFVIRFLVVDVCPPLVRKAFIEGLVKLMSTVLDVPLVNEGLVHIWSKVYRAMEQAMIANIVDY